MRMCRWAKASDNCASSSNGGNKPLQLRLPIWLIHNETGSPDRSLRKLAEKLHQPCFGLAMPEDCSELRCMDDLATAHLECVRRLQPVGPYVLVGCSLFGSLLAAAMTFNLERWADLSCRLSDLHGTGVFTQAAVVPSKVKLGCVRVSLCSYTQGAM